MSELITVIDSIIENKKIVLERVEEFFKPLKEKYVTEVITRVTKIKKILGFVISSKYEDVRESVPLQIKYIINYKDEVVISIIVTEDNRHGDIFSHPNNTEVTARIPMYLFHLNDKELANTEEMLSFIKRFLTIAITK